MIYYLTKFNCPNKGKKLIPKYKISRICPFRWKRVIKVTMINLPEDYYYSMELKQLKKYL